MIILVLVRLKLSSSSSTNKASIFDIIVLVYAKIIIAINLSNANGLYRLKTIQDFAFSNLNSEDQKHGAGFDEMEMTRLTITIIKHELDSS